MVIQKSCESSRQILLSSNCYALKRRTEAESNTRKTDGMDGSELRNTLKGMEHGKGAEVRNEVRKKGEYGTYNIG